MYIIIIGFVYFYFIYLVSIGAEVDSESSISGRWMFFTILCIVPALILIICGIESLIGSFHN